MSDLETNKRIVHDFFQAWNERDFAKATELLAEDLEWSIIGGTTVSGERNKREMKTALKFLPRIFEGFRFTLHETTAEADRVVVIAESHGTHKSGRAYNNHYSFHMRIKEQRIARVREFFDTEHATWVETGRTGQASTAD